MTVYDKDELGAQAKDLLESKAFREATKRLREHYYNILLSEPVGSLTAATAHASMKVLDQFSQELALFISEARNAMRKGG